MTPGINIAENVPHSASNNIKPLKGDLELYDTLSNQLEILEYQLGTYNANSFFLALEERIRDNLAGCYFLPQEHADFKKLTQEYELLALQYRYNKTPWEQVNEKEKQFSPRQKLGQFLLF